MSSAFRSPGSIVRALVLALALGRNGLDAQSSGAVGFVDVRSETESRLRLLQIVGAVPLYPWSVRSLSPRELDRLDTTSAARPWIRREVTHGDTATIAWRVLPLQTGALFNSAFPYGINDGAIWAGRGLTAAIQGGIAARWRHVSLQIEPLVFHAQNSSFDILPTGRSGAGAFGNAFNQYIDLPQRFGDGGYTRLDGGNSTLRIDYAWFAGAVSTANQFWGPAIENPVILGDNAGGFPHAYIGTSHPVDIRIGRVQGRLVWGRLDQSASSPQVGLGARRFMSGIVGIFVPKGAPGLEIGATRFFHTPWPDDGLLHAPFLKPLGGVFKRSFSRVDNETGTDTLDNQLASVFARWVFPGSGLEIYGEYGKEDHNQDTRDLYQEPDHQAAYLIGFQRAWRRAPDELLSLRGEILNSRISHLDQRRAQAPWYTHFGGVQQGHTALGQVLGSAGGFGGGAAFLAMDRVTPTGRWTLSTARFMRAEARLAGTTGLPVSARSDVMQTLGIERMVMTPNFEVVGGATGVLDLNRDFRRDQFNLNLSLTLRAYW